MSKRKITNQRDKRRGGYQWGYGARPRSNWGAGELLSPWAEGDVVEIPAGSRSLVRRVDYGPGRYRVVSAFSIGEGDEWYFRVCPIGDDGETQWDKCSDRLHMIPASAPYANGEETNYTADWLLVESADPENVRDWPVHVESRWRVCSECGSRVRA